MRMRLGPLCAAICAAWIASSSGAAFALEAFCVISDDRASIEVYGTSDPVQNFECTVRCKATSESQHAFTPVICNFYLRAGSPQKMVCDQGGGGLVFKTIASQNFSCVPRK